jgi:hypothetical protein
VLASFAIAITVAKPSLAQQTPSIAPPNHRLYATTTDHSGVSYSFFFQETSRMDANVSGQVTVRAHLAEGKTREELLRFTAACRQQPNAPPHVRYFRPQSDEAQAVVTFDAETLKSSEAIQEPMKLWLAVCYESPLAEHTRAPAQPSQGKPGVSIESEKTQDSQRPTSVKLAALPADNNIKAYDGTWTINWTNTTGCKIPGGSYTITIANGMVNGTRKSGSIAGSGAVAWRSINRFGYPVAYRGKFTRSAGSGSFRNLEKEHCAGVFTASRS